MRVERRVGRVEPRDDAERHLVGPHRIEERAAEHIPRERPPHGVRHVPERSRDLPDLFHAQREDLGIPRRDAAPLQPPLRQAPSGAFGEHGDPGAEVGGRLVVCAGPPVPAEPGRRGAHPADPLPLDQQGIGWKPREHVDPGGFRLLAEPAHHLTERRDVVAVVPHGRRRRDSKPAVPGEEPYLLPLHRLPERQRRLGEVGKELPEHPGIHYRAGEAVLAETSSLLQDSDGKITDRTVQRGEAGELDRTGEPRGTAAHEQHVQLDRVGARRLGADQAVERKGGLVSNRQDRRQA